MKVRQCKDCKREGRTGKPLNAPYQGPRCHRHHQLWQKRLRTAAADGRRAKAYQMTPERYQSLLEAQGGGCAICGRKPAKRQLAVDHDHSCCPGKVACGDCTRGLLCWSCNKYLQHLNDDVERAQRLANYLQDPPAQSVALVANNPYS